MLRVIFTLDYEIHGNGSGSPLDLMVKPTDRLLRLFDKHGAKLTIMADVAEILKFKEYRDQNNRDDYYYEAIVEQLQRAVKTGHDVQLHIHPSYFNARHEKGVWLQDLSEYDLAGLPYERIELMIRTCKEFLEGILKPVDPAYKCVAFRAANWCVSPSGALSRALLANGITIDTSVFKWGRRQGLVNFDYSSAHHQFLPWPADPDSISMFNANSPLWEFPIYSENRWLGAFFSPNRIYRAILGKLHKVDSNSTAQDHKGQNAARGKTKPLWAISKNAWKADFNQCSGRQLIRAIRRAEKQVSGQEVAPFVLIGHSKLFNTMNDISVKPFLRFAQERTSSMSFGTLRCMACADDCGSIFNTTGLLKNG